MTSLLARTEARTPTSIPPAVLPARQPTLVERSVSLVIPQKHSVERDEEAPLLSEHFRPLRRDTNVIVLARLQELRFLKFINVFLALGAVVYFATNVALLVLNAYPEDSVVSKMVFHRIEFGATFLYTLDESLALIWAPERKYRSPKLLKLLIFLSVAISFTGTLLVYINLEEFEVPSHELEYCNEITMALIDMMLVSTLVRNNWRSFMSRLSPGGLEDNHYRRNDQEETTSASRSARSKGGDGSPPPAPRRSDSKVASGGFAQRPRPKLEGCIVVTVVILAFCSAIINIVVYNGLGWTDGDPNGEQTAHFLEFSFELVNASIGFWFTIDNVMLADKLKFAIMLQPEGHRSAHISELPEDAA